MQAYSDPKRESDPHALPDVEVFHVPNDYPLRFVRVGGESDEEGEALEPGWYWWSCFPGCLPDGDPVGPYLTQAEALADAQDGNELEDDDRG